MNLYCWLFCTAPYLSYLKHRTTPKIDNFLFYLFSLLFKSLRISCIVATTPDLPSPALQCITILVWEAQGLITGYIAAGVSGTLLSGHSVNKI